MPWLRAHRAREQLSLPSSSQLCGQGGSIPGGISSGANIDVQGRSNGGTSTSTLTRGFHGMVLRLSSHPKPIQQLTWQPRAPETPCPCCPVTRGG